MFVDASHRRMGASFVVYLKKCEIVRNVNIDSINKQMRIKTKTKRKIQI